MFGDEGSGFISSEKKETSDEYTAQVDKKVKQLLDESFDRVSQLLTKKDWELWEMSKNLFWFDYLDYNEIETIV